MSTFYVDGEEREGDLLCWGHEIKALGKPRPAGSHFFTSHLEGPESKAALKESVRNEDRQNSNNLIETQDPPVPKAKWTP